MCTLVCRWWAWKLRSHAHLAELYGVMHATAFANKLPALQLQLIYFHHDMSIAVLEREREGLHLSSHTGLMQVLPGHPLADTITEYSVIVCAY